MAFWLSHLHHLRVRVTGVGHSVQLFKTKQQTKHFLGLHEGVSWLLCLQPWCWRILRLYFSSDYFDCNGYCQVTVLKTNGKAASEALLLSISVGPLLQAAICVLPQPSITQKAEGFSEAHRSAGWSRSCADLVQASRAAGNVWLQWPCHAPKMVLRNSSLSLALVSLLLCLLQCFLGSGG